MGICRSRWGRTLRLGLSQLGGTLHASNFSFPKVRLIRRRWLRVIGFWTVHGASSLFIVGSIRSGPISRQPTA